MNELLKDGWDPRPKCWNRPPREWGRVRVYWDEDGNRREVGLPNGWFVDGCATWAGRGIGPNGEPYPVANGFRCHGCRWLPAEASQWLDTTPPPPQDAS
jgi:hypothetical protein